MEVPLKNPPVGVVLIVNGLAFTHTIELLTGPAGPVKVLKCGTSLTTTVWLLTRLAH